MVLFYALKRKVDFFVRPKNLMRILRKFVVDEIKVFHCLKKFIKDIIKQKRGRGQKKK